MQAFTALSKMAKSLPWKLLHLGKLQILPRLESLDRDKHSSLLALFVTDEEKIYNSGPRLQLKTFYRLYSKEG